MRVGDLQAVEEEGNTRGRKTLARDSGTTGHRRYEANRPLPAALLFTTLNSNEAQGDHKLSLPAAGLPEFGG